MSAETGEEAEAVQVESVEQVEPIEPIEPVARASRLTRLREKGVLRIGWGIGDQAISSLTNFAVTVTVARALGAEHFGAFTLAFVTYSFALNASKGLTSDPLMVRFSATDERSWRNAVAQASGTALLVGLVLGACLIAIAVPISGPARGAFLALGLTTPGLLLQDSWRYAFFAAGRGEQAFLNDALWGVLLVPALILASVTGHRDAFWFVLAWGSAATVAAIVGIFQAKVLPRPSRAKEWLSRQRDLGFRYLLEGTSSSVATQLRTYGVGIILGLAAVGYIQGATTLMGPIMIVFFGSSTVMVPELARVIRRAPHLLATVCFGFGALLATAALIWGIVLLVALPHGLGNALLGEVWGPAYPLVLLATLAVMGGSLQAGAGAGLRALGAARRSLRAMLVTQVIYVTFGLGGALAGGAKGTMQAGVAASAIGAAIWWWQMRLALRESDIPHGHIVAQLTQAIRSRASARS